MLVHGKQQNKLRNAHHLSIIIRMSSSFQNIQVTIQVLHGARYRANPVRPLTYSSTTVLKNSSQTFKLSREGIKAAERKQMLWRFSLMYRLVQQQQQQQHAMPLQSLIETPALWYNESFRNSYESCTSLKRGEFYDKTDKTWISELTLV